MCWTDVWCLTGAVADSSPGEECRVFCNWYFKVQVDEDYSAAIKCTNKDYSGRLTIFTCVGQMYGA